jgi:hypothetical protein
LVPDFNQILLKRGGIFTYPALADAPQGKMRLLFEALPLALLIEQAGGRAVPGEDPSPLAQAGGQPVAPTSRRQLKILSFSLRGAIGRHPAGPQLRPLNINPSVSCRFVSSLPLSGGVRIPSPCGRR